MPFVRIDGNIIHILLEPGQQLTVEMVKYYKELIRESMDGENDPTRKSEDKQILVRAPRRGLTKNIQ